MVELLPSPNTSDGFISGRIFLPSTSVSILVSSTNDLIPKAVKVGVVKSGALDVDDAFRNRLRSPASPISETPPPIAV